MFGSTLLAASALSLLSGVHAHMVITSPVPFDQTALNNSPLNADGSDFPCKVGGGSGYTYSVTKMNEVEVGQAQNISFMGSATHGGGSCQISVTLDKNPDKNSQWKVVHSIIGGCPANIAGNVPADSASYTGPPLASFQWTLPKGMPNGQYTMAWTWLNKIGNREFYMNCAPIQVTGGGSSNDVFDKLPNMFVANIPPTECSTPESVNFLYPDPGDSVETAQSSDIASTFAVSAGCASVTNLGAGAGKAGTPAQATGSASGGSDSGSSSADGGMIGSSPTTAAPSPSGSADGNTGGVFAPGASSASQATTMATSVASVPAATSAPAAAAPSTPAASAPASGSSGSAASGSVACTAEGFYCIDSTTFGMCAQGSAVPQQVPAGTSCTATGLNFAVKQVIPGTEKRDHVHRSYRPHAHMHRNALGYDF